MQYDIRHTTTYSYGEPVSQCNNLVHLIPRNTRHQRCLSSSISVKPLPARSSRRIDYFGNNTFHFSVDKPHQELTVTMSCRVEVEDLRPSLNLDFGNTCGQAWRMLRESHDQETLLAREYLLDSPQVRFHQELKAYAEPFFTEDRPLLSGARELTRQIYTDFKYDPGFTTVSTPLSEVLAHRRGVCQDFAHLAIGCLRAVGLPARYVSGYLETLPPPGQKKLVGADATHAWLAVYSPGEGWFEFDPTNDKIAEEQHITTAWGRDYADVAPLKGVIFGGGGQQTLAVAVDVNRVSSMLSA